jgi:heptosyltransferase-3
MKGAPHPPPRRALIITMRYLGDVLLATPLAHALRARYPGCEVDMLVFASTQAVLKGNPDIAAVHALADRPGKSETFALMRRIWRQYDIAIVAQPGDRPHMFGWAAAPVRYGFVPHKTSQAWWKRPLLRAPLDGNPNLHRVIECERLALAMGLGPAREVVPPSAGMERDAWGAFDFGEGARLDPRRPYAVVHPMPRWRYKQWHQAGWHGLLAHLASRGLQIVLTGGPGASDADYVDDLLAHAPAQAKAATIRAQGRLSLAQMADLLKHASLYVGPDTAPTHLAAACGTPVVALYGPTDPTLWGPWPARYPACEWRKTAPLQRQGNVILLQHAVRDCVPCQEEGCERRRDSHSDCLDEMPLSAVLNAVSMLLQGGL